MLQCTACGGKYNPTNADGTAYFHACPPLSAGELQAAVTAGKVVLPGGETAAIAVQQRRYERLQARNENIVPAADPKQPATMKANGKGAVDIGAPPITDAPVKVDV